MGLYDVNSSMKSLGGRIANVFKRKPQVATNTTPQYASNAQSTQSMRPTTKQFQLPKIMPPVKPVVSKPPNPWEFTDTAPKKSMVSPMGPQQVPGIKPPSPAQLPTPQPAAQPVAQPPSATDTYLSNVSTFGKQQQDKERARELESRQYIKDQYGLSNQSLEASIPEYESNFNVFKANSDAGVADMRKSGDVQRQNTRDYYGEAQRLDAKNRDQTRGQTGRTFAALGTTESRGEGSYQQGMENIDSEFNSVTSKRLSEQAGKLTEIDSIVGKAERDSIAAIQGEEAKKNTLIRQIRLAQQQNKLDEKQSLIAAYNASQDNIAKIQENLDGLKYQSELEKEKISAASKALEQEYAGLSPEFIKLTGAKNMNELMFRKNNSGMFDKIKPGEVGVNSSMVSKKKALGIAQELQKLNTSGITGPIKMAVSPESKKAETLLGQLSAELQLEEAKRLKGQGSLTDAEREILRQAVSDFGINKNYSGRSNLYNTQFRQHLDNLVNNLSAETGVSGQSDQVSELKALGLSDQEIQEYLGGK